MDRKSLKILLSDNNRDDNDWLAKILQDNKCQDELKSVRQLREVAHALDRDNYDILLLDGFDSSSQNLAELKNLQQKAPQLPIVVLSDDDNLQLAVGLLHRGIQDCLVKAELKPKTLVRSMQYAIARQRQEFELRQEALMKQMLDRIRSSIDLEEILETTATIIQEFFQTDRVIIYRCESKQLAETTVVSQSVDAKFDRLAIEQFIGAVNLSSLQAILSKSTDVQTKEDTFIASPEDIQVIEPKLVRSYLILPVWMPELMGEDEDLAWGNDAAVKTASEYRPKKLWGMVVAYNASHPRKWQEWEIEFLRKLTTQVTVAIQQSQLCCRLQTVNHRLQKLAILDGLTGIANRRYFDLVLDKEWQRLAREQQPLSLILCDVDYFKAYNDTYGHQQGDRCLQKLAQILQQSTRRAADLPARYGGEEFALILPNTNAPGALFLAHNIIRQLAQKHLIHESSQVSDIVTLSIGVTTKIPQPNQPSSTIIEAADNLLYRAKRAGRDRVAVDNWLSANQDSN